MQCAREEECTLNVERSMFKLTWSKFRASCWIRGLKRSIYGWQISLEHLNCICDSVYKLVIRCQSQTSSHCNNFRPANSGISYINTICHNILGNRWPQTNLPLCIRELSKKGQSCSLVTLCFERQGPKDRRLFILFIIITFKNKIQEKKFKSRICSLNSTNRPIEDQFEVNLSLSEMGNLPCTSRLTVFLISFKLFVAVHW